MLLGAGVIFAMARASAAIAAVEAKAVPPVCRADADRYCATEDSFAARFDNQVLCLRAFRVDIAPLCRRAIGIAPQRSDFPGSRPPRP